MEYGELDNQDLYDKSNPKSIEEFAKKLIGHNFEEVISWNIKRYGAVKDAPDSDNKTDSYSNKKRKGGLGNLLEEVYFGYKLNSDSNADFYEAGVELKVTPYEKNKKGDLRAGERLVLTMISNDAPVEEDFFKSHLWEKCRLILLIYYLRDKTLPSNLMYSIDYVTLFQPPDNDLEIIKQDYNKIISKIKAGKAHEISEGDTIYLGACTKGATAAKSTVPQFYPPHTPARRRAFCYKNSYMTYVLNTYITQGIETYEPIIKNIDELKQHSFEEIITNKINQYIGTSDRMLCSLFNREYNNNKAQWIDLAYRMLGIKSNRAEEFIKANIVVKAIRLDEKGRLKENSPLPPFKFMDLVNEAWEDSTLYNYLCDVKFLYVVFQKFGDEYVLRGCQLWNMPVHDLDEVQGEWERVKNIVVSGVKFSMIEQKDKIIVHNNLPKKSENRITHLRPHTQQTYYQFSDGTIFGKGNITDSDLLPDGQRMTKQSFWLNNSYILSQLDKSLTKPLIDR